MSTAARLALDRGAPPWLFGSALLATAPHALHQPVWLSLFSGLLIAWAGWLWWRDARLPGRWLLIGLVVLACAGILLEFRTLFGRDAGVGLLVILASMKLLEMKSRRDAMVIVILDYFLLLTHYFFSQSIPTGLWLLVSIWLVSAALIRVSGGVACRPAPTLRHAGTLLAQAIPFMIVLYLLFPRISGPLWGLPQDAHSGKTGLSDTMSPGSISDLVQSGAIAFRVRFDGEPPPRQQLYWRGPVMELFDGRIWRPHPGQTAAEQIEALSAPVSYETTLEAHSQRWLLALDAPVTLPADTALNGTLTALSRQSIDQRRRVAITSALTYRFNSDERPPVIARNLALPPGINPRTRGLAESWRQRETSPQAIVDQALRLFASKDFSYTLRPPLLGENALDQFIFETRRGFCEHYAAAFVFLMRAAGVPARVVGGYQGGEMNPLDGYLVVRQSDAHAWAEVWLAGRGWVRIDPTSVVAPARLEAGIADALPQGEPLPALIQIRADWLRTLRHRWEAVNNAWNQHILGYDPQRQRELLSRLGLPDADWRQLAFMLAAICALLLGVVTAWTLYHRPRRDPASRLWQHALRHLRRRRVDCPPWETPHALLTRVEATQPALAPAFRRVVEAYLGARYGEQPHQLDALRLAVKQLP